MEALEYTVWDFIERLATDTQTTIALYQQEQEQSETVLAETHSRLKAISELLDENHVEKERLNRMYQKNRCDDDYFEAEWARLEQEHAALIREQQKAERTLEKQTANLRQRNELEAIGQDIRNGSEEASFEKKRTILERLRTEVTVEGTDEDGVRWIVLEVLGYRKRICLKNHSAQETRTATAPQRCCAGTHHSF